MRHRWRLQLSHPPIALTLGLSQSGTEQLKNLGTIARMRLTRVSLLGKIRFSPGVFTQ